MFCVSGVFISLAEHPLSCIGPAMNEFDTAFFASAEESNYIDVDERYSG